MSKVKNKLGLVVFLCFILTTSLAASGAFACTGLSLTGEDGTVVYGRTMEWGAFDLHTRILVVPRAAEFQGQTPDGINGKRWNARYGFLGFELLDRAVADGMNEKGLAAGMFYHHGFAEYSEYSPALSSQSMSPADVLPFILSSFSTVGEVRVGMEKIRVVPVKDPALGMAVYLHLMVTDSEGKKLVIEFKDGKTKFFNNPVGVITNNPTFDWHLTNLRNYGYLSREAFQDKKWGDLKISPLASGSGLLGVPGDFTSPSRFVRAVVLAQTARSTSGGVDTVQEFFRIMDSFDVGAKQGEGSDQDQSDNLPADTVWTSCHDTKNLITYYHTAFNRRLRSINLKNIDFSKPGKRSVPLDTKRVQDIQDITDKL
jgi:choloylglycine hydrolase